MFKAEIFVEPNKLIFEGFIFVLFHLAVTKTFIWESFKEFHFVEAMLFEIFKPKPIIW